MNDRLYDDYRRDSRERANREGRREDRRFEEYGAGPYEYSGARRRDDDRGYGMERDRDHYFGSRQHGYGRDYGHRYPLGSSDDSAWGRGGPGAERFAGESSYPRSHRGKGPSNYERSDERMKELICERLSDDDDIDARGVSVTVSDGEVTFDGTVDSRREKYLVEECAEHCGAKEIRNNLKIEARADAGGRNEWRGGTRGASDESRGQSSTGGRPGNGGRSSTGQKAAKSQNR
jgi:hypothetical protein